MSTYIESNNNLAANQNNGSQSIYSKEGKSIYKEDFI